MNDRELLELAAKAAGVKLGSPSSAGGFYCCEYNEATRTYGEYRVWNPLTDDGDAFRLAVKLRLQLVQMDTAGGQPVLRIEGPGLDRTYEILDTDPYAATRRAIVRAAAQIGRQQ